MATHCKGRLWAPFVLVAAVSIAVSAAPAQTDPALGLPLACPPDLSCYIQRYVDRDPGPGALDFACGSLTGDGHKGTDFALPSQAAMRADVPVIASAAGTVTAVRDGMEDVAATAESIAAMAGRDCGNGVVIDLGGGWQTQYCHLRQGSISVAPGEVVAEGDPLGLVGMSGAASFPHVHLSLRQDGTVIDPFRPDDRRTCAGTAPPGLWQSPPPYRPLGLVSAGLSSAVPEYTAVRDGLPEDGLGADPAALVVWAYFFGGESADVIRLAIAGPQGPLGSTDVALERSQPLLFRAWGRRAPPGGWPDGAYSGTITLLRGGQVIETSQVAATIP